MSSTPTNKNSKPTTPPKTLGWSQALFGSSWLSSKKTSHVASSTGSTASKASLRPSPKPFQNLEGFNAIHSPDQGGSKAFTTMSDGALASTAVSALPIQQSERGSQPSPAVPSKSPWKASPMGAANGTRFSVGNLKPPSSLRAGPTRSNNRNNFTISTTVRVEPMNRVRRRNKYKTSGVFQVRRNNNRGRNTPIDKTQMNKLLLNARPAIEASSQKIESDRNFRTAFANRKCGRGKRLQPLHKNRRNGRLPAQLHPGDATTSMKFLTNGKRNAERDDDYDYDRETTEVASTRKKRRVNFGGEENNATMPIENLVTTPAKDFGSRANKRRATPYKRGETVNEDADNDDDDNDSDGEDTKMATNRKLLKIKRSPSSKKPDPKLRTNHVERVEDFPVMPSSNIVTDFSTWSTPEERESSITITSNSIIPDNYFNWFPPGPAPILTQLMSSGVPQFEQKPLFLGPKQDRTVRDDDDDDETGHDAKRARGETWNCETCGKDNDDDETHCQILVDNGKGGKKKCGTGRSSKVILGWGDMFSHLTKDKVKCDVCKVWNEKSATKCVSCDEDLPSSTGKNDKSSAIASTSTANAAKPPASLGGSIGSKGFSFGGGVPAGNISSTGFSFGNTAATGTAAAPSSSITTSGFTFGAPASSASASSSKATSGGFQFGAPATAKSPAATTSAASSTTASGGFQFGAPAKEKAASAPSTATQSSAPPPASSDAAPKPFSFGSSSAAPAPSPSPNAGVTAAPAPSTGTNSGAQLFGNFATSSTSSAQAPKFSFGTSKDASSTAKQESAKVPITEPASTTKDNNGESGAPAFSFGSTSTTASATVTTTTPGFSFGSSSAKTSAAPTDSAANATFSFVASTGSSAGSSSAVMPSLGSVATEGSDDRSSKKKRRGGFDSNTASSQPTMSFGSKTSSEAPAQAVTPAPFVFGKPSTNPTKDNSSVPTSGFGSSAAPPSFGNTSNNSLAASGPPAPNPAPTFGSTPAPVAPLSFGSTPAPAPAAPFSFGSTPAPVAPAFGSTAPAPAAPMTFGSTPAAGPSSGFGSTPAPPNAMNFGSTTPAQSSTTFGSTPAAVPGFGAPMAFGSTTPAPAPVPFGAAPAGPPQPFGNTPVSNFNNTATTFGTAQPTAGAAPLAFGGPPAQPPSGFGAGGFGQQAPQQQPPAPPNAGFSLGTGGGGPRGGRTPGRRRIVKARRPGGQR